MDGLLEILLVPGIVCFALSIEIGFKALLLQSKAPARGHDLSELFTALTPDHQDSLVLATGVDREVFIAELAQMKDAFTHWRYDYEHSDLDINLGFQYKLAQATQEVMTSAIGA